MPKLILLVSVLLVGQPAFALDYIRLAAMNIEHCGNRTPPQRPIAIAEHIMLACPDILVLSEIYDNDGDESARTNDILDTAFAMLNENQQYEWKYELFPNKQAIDKSQLCAIAWDAKRVTKVGETFKVDVHDDDDSFNSWDRAPHAIKLSAGSGKTDIVIIPLHMKANVLSGNNSQNLNQRAHEAELLVAQLDAVRDSFDDEDIVLLGDTNILSSNETAMRTFVAAGFDDLNDEGVGTYIDNKAPFDRILVPSGRQGEEFAFSRQYVVRACDPGAHEEFLSDHQMVLTVVKLMDDDD